MWDYIVLGQVPGTSIQVSFDNWLAGMACLAGGYCLYKIICGLARNHVVAAIRIGLVIQQSGDDLILASRQHLRV